ncbi:flagellar hook-basal body protein [Alkalicoccus luteus]|uniref:flagellar hook-basal body protein n=1 Tax=Alkalicoccus luteus TaxID=1237094 RepID=UPI004033E103
MLRGLYTAGAGMIAQQRRQEMLTNNMANAETPGYKADQASMRTFPNMLLEARGGNGPHGRIGALATGVYMQERTPNFRQGDVQETGNSLDVALLEGTLPEGAALMFETASEDGARYTRSGSFTVDAEGFLTTPSGNYILDTDGNEIEAGSEQITITPEGQVLDADDNEIAQLSIVVIPEAAQLVKEGEGLFAYEGEEAAVTAVGNEEAPYTLEQGFIERSNVDSRQTMTEMMNMMRTFEANQKMLQAYDQSLERAVNDIGRVQ